MKKWKRVIQHVSYMFSEHPHTLGETYLQHFFSALLISVKLLFSGVACLVHAFIPFLFVKTAGNTVTSIHEYMLARKSRNSGA